MTEENRAPEEKPFFPGGAILFFVLLVGFYNLIWFAMYWIMVARG